MPRGAKPAMQNEMVTRRASAVRIMRMMRGIETLAIMTWMETRRRSRMEGAESGVCLETSHCRLMMKATTERNVEKMKIIISNILRLGLSSHVCVLAAGAFWNSPGVSCSSSIVAVDIISDPAYSELLGPELYGGGASKGLGLWRSSSSVS